MPPVPNTWIKEVLATVAVPPVTVTAPPLMKNRSGCVAADDDRVVEVIVEHREQAGGGGEPGRDRHGSILSKCFRSRGCVSEIRSGYFVSVHADDFDRYVELNSCFGALTRTVAVDSSDRAEM